MDLSLIKSLSVRYASSMAGEAAGILSVQAA
jgi:hypothetical protein